MKELSIIIPSLRPEQLAGSIKSIETYTEADYEIIVISPTMPEVVGKKDHIVWVEETQRGGVVKAVNEGYAKSSGEWVTTFSDEVRAMFGWDKKMIDFLKQHDRKTMGNFRVIEHGEHPQFFYYGMMFSCFPFLRKSFCDEIGGLFRREFKAFYADPDLGMRVWAACGHVLTCKDAFLYHPYLRDGINEGNRRDYEQEDKETFIKFWGHLEGHDRPFYKEERYA